MDPTATAEPIQSDETALAQQMQVTFDTDELASFFDGFAPLEIAAEVLATLEPAQ